MFPKVLLAFLNIYIVFSQVNSIKERGDIDKYRRRNVRRKTLLDQSGEVQGEYLDPKINTSFNPNIEGHAVEYQSKDFNEQGNSLIENAAHNFEQWQPDSDGYYSNINIASSSNNLHHGYKHMGYSTNIPTGKNYNQYLTEQGKTPNENIIQSYEQWQPFLNNGEHASSSYSFPQPSHLSYGYLDNTDIDTNIPDYSFVNPNFGDLTNIINEPNTFNQYPQTGLLQPNTLQVIPDTKNDNEDELKMSDEEFVDYIFNELDNPFRDNDNSNPETMPAKDLRNHNFIQIHGRSHKTRKRCICSTRSSQKYANTVCDICKKFMCAECFKREHGLETLPTITTTRLPDQICSHCNQNLGTDPEILLEHGKTCEKVENRKFYYTCYKCGKIFKGKEIMTRHIRTHTGECPFKCPQPNCEYAGKLKTNLNKHMLRIHGTELKNYKHKGLKKDG